MHQSPLKEWGMWMGNLISVQEATVLFCQEGDRVLQASVVLLVSCRVDLGDGLFLSAAIYCLQTIEKAVWAADETQTRYLHTANSRGSCGALFKSRRDSKAGVSPPAGHKEHDTQHKNTSCTQRNVDLSVMTMQGHTEGKGACLIRALAIFRGNWSVLCSAE